MIAKETLARLRHMCSPLLLGLAQCVEPLEAPSAFSTEEYLCEADHAALLEARVEQCRQAYALDRSCKGIMSFRGLIDAQPVVMDSELSAAQYQDNVTPGTGRTVTINGHSPYFNVRLDLSFFAIPPDVTQSGPVATGAVVCTSGVSSICRAMDLLNLEVRGGNYLASLTSETRDIRVETPGELRVALRADLSRGGYMEGCFVAFDPHPAP
jgi:hypothetical protein